METNAPIPLTRDVEAVMIPSGTKVTLEKDQPAYITQSLGGTYTVIVNGNMFRIDGKNADALGKEVVETKKDLAAATEPVKEEEIWNMLRSCFDPEIPVNIVDLGLVYDMKVTPLPSGAGSRVDVKMTLTAPGCGMGDVLRQDVENKLMGLDGVTEAHAELVWEPQWNQSMMSEAARLQLGLM